MITQTPLQLLAKTYSVKKRFLAMYKRANAGHIGASLSCAEILVFIKFSWMKNGDELILSKGHAAGALYALLAEAGDISELDIQSFYNNETYLAGHPPPGKIKGIPFATGSLGHGLSISAGMALSAKLRQENDRLFFCVTSDGELNEGSIWEAALFITQNQLNNIVWLIDRNRIQGFGRTEQVMKLEPLKSKLEAFGFAVTESDGHSFDQLILAKKKVTENLSFLGRPQVIICETIKGNGVSYMRDTIDCHYLPMTDDQYGLALQELKSFYGLKGIES